MHYGSSLLVTQTNMKNLAPKLLVVMAICINYCSCEISINSFPSTNFLQAQPSDIKIHDKKVEGAINANVTSNSIVYGSKNKFGSLLLGKFQRLIPLKLFSAGKFLLGKFWGSQFVGRCFGVARKLKFVIPLIIFKLGVIVTILVFLSVFSLKSLAIGVLLVILNITKTVAGLAFLKGTSLGHSKHGEEAGIHYHIYGKGGPSPFHSGSYHMPHIHDEIWIDRISDRLSQATSTAERQELLNLYQRIGFARNSREMRF